MNSSRNKVVFTPSFREVNQQILQIIKNFIIAVLNSNNYKAIRNQPSGILLRQGVKFSFILFTFALFSSCDYNRRSTGWEYMGDMTTSPAYESYTSNPNFTDGKTMQAPVPGTIPRGIVPYPYEKNEEDRALAAATLVNKLKASEENLERGERMYGIYCMQCHGEKGDGQGSLYVNKKYTYPPASLLSEKMMSASEGDVYHVITVGHGIMAEHGSMIQPDDRWKITMYIKEELQK